MAAERTSAQQSDAIAAGFVEARRQARALGQFPGPIPADLQGAYACQDAAIALWPDAIGGWKVGRLAPDQQKIFGQMRLAGPIFQKHIARASGTGSVDIPVFKGGFAAVESEFVLRIGRDAPPGKSDWSHAEAAEMVAACFIGIENASSPLASINDLGATVIVADFGNNAGLIVGNEIPDWRSRPLDSLTCVASIDGVKVGEGSAANIPGGPVDALRFLLEHGAQRGRPLKQGMYISTGAATGIHHIRAGQSAVVDFGKDGRIACRAVEAAPRT